MSAQKKKDLLDEIDKLRSELKVTNQKLNESRKNEKASASLALSMEAQVKNLKETNASLLANMSSFTALSNKKAENLETSLNSIKLKDKQLNVINKSLSDNDSTKLALITLFKNTVGSDASVSVKKGTIYLTIPNSKLFGENDSSYTIKESAKSILGRIATTLNANPELKIIVEGNSNTLKFNNKMLVDNWDLSTKQASSIVRVLQNDFKANPKNMKALGRSEYGSESIETVTHIIIDPKFDEFYTLIKENMKNESK